MKWYAYKDDGTNYTMILDHNTTPIIAWNSSGNNADGMKEVADSLANDTTGWKGSPRLITADEVAEITKNTTFNSKITDHNGYFYFETNSTNKPSLFEGTYGWLYSNTAECTSYGCGISDDNKYEYGTEKNIHNVFGYWTSTSVHNNDIFAWRVISLGYMSGNYVDEELSFGVRPVITIDKSIIK